MKPRPSVLSGFTAKVKTGCENCYVILNFDDGVPFEVFVVIGKSGGCRCTMLEGIGRLLSLHLRSGGNIGDAIEQLEGLRCPEPFADKNLSCLDGLAKALKEIAEDAEAHDER